MNQTRRSFLRTLCGAVAAIVGLPMPTKPKALYPCGTIIRVPKGMYYVEGPIKFHESPVIDWLRVKAG